MNTITIPGFCIFFSSLDFGGIFIYIFEINTQFPRNIMNLTDCVTYLRSYDVGLSEKFISVLDHEFFYYYTIYRQE